MGKIEGPSALKAGEQITLEQWRTWPEGERWELIGGIAYCMSPAPRVCHQSLAGSLYVSLCRFLDDRPCEPFFAPVDVFLPDGDPESAETVVQPDVIVVCDEDLIEDDGIHGAPAFIAEVLSPATAHKDLSRKKNRVRALGRQGVLAGQSRYAFRLPLGAEGRQVRTGRRELEGRPS